MKYSPQVKPKNVQVLNRLFKISYIPRHMAEALESKNSGACRTVEQEILIQDELHPEYTAEVFLHELCHAICSQMQCQDNGDEERYVSNISAGLATVWKQNPEIVLWLHQLITGGKLESIKRTVTQSQKRKSKPRNKKAK